MRDAEQSAGADARDQARKGPIEPLERIMQRQVLKVCLDDLVGLALKDREGEDHVELSSDGVGSMDGGVRIPRYPPLGNLSRPGIDLGADNLRVPEPPAQRCQLFSGGTAEREDATRAGGELRDHVEQCRVPLFRGMGRCLMKLGAMPDARPQLGAPLGGWYKACNIEQANPARAALASPLHLRA
jgi:hypothetical protein